MFNQATLVGRLVRDLEIHETDNGTKVSNLILAIPRPYKNADGAYDTDYIDITLWSNIAEATSEYCKKGDLVAVKARLQSDNYEKDGEKKFSMKVVAEKVSFLSTKAKTEPEPAI